MDKKVHVSFVKGRYNLVFHCDNKVYKQSYKSFDTAKRQIDDFIFYLDLEPKSTVVWYLDKPATYKYRNPLKK